MTILLGLAVACGVLSALTGNRTAWALLASLGFCLFLDWQGVPFNAPLWLLIDLAVMLMIFRPWPYMTNADIVILALFLPAWVGYLQDEALRHKIGALVVSTQFLLTYRHGPTVELVERVAAKVQRWFAGGQSRMVVAYA